MHGQDRTSPDGVRGEYVAGMTRTCSFDRARRGEVPAAARSCVHLRGRPLSGSVRAVVRFRCRAVATLATLMLARLVLATLMLAMLPSRAPLAAQSQVPSPAAARAPRLDGKVPILEYHLIGGTDGRWSRSVARFRSDLALLYARGYRPVTVGELLDKKLDIPAGTSPVVVTFDDASPGQFRYLERDGKLEIDPESAVGIWLDFSARHPDWRNKATFCLLPAASAGHAFFGNGGVEGQKTEWRLRKVRFLAEQGFELCNHTLWHAQLDRYDDGVVQEQIARGGLAIDSAVAGYPVRTFALPLGIWPKNRTLARSGEWRDKHSGRVARYRFDAILEVSGHPSPGPFSAAWNPLSLHRQQVLGDALVKLLDRLESERLVVGARAPEGRP